MKIGSGKSLLKYNDWMLLLGSLVVLIALVFIRPELLRFERFQEKTTATLARNTELRPPILAVARFANRAEESSRSAGVTTFYRHSRDRDGLSDDIISTHLHVVWNHPEININEHTASKSSPVVDETGVYVGGDSGWFYAFDLEGKLRWKFHADAALRGIHSTPFLYKGLVCIGAYNASFYCLDKLNGFVVWTMSFTSGAVGASPLITDDTFINNIETGRPPDSFTMRMNISDGTLVWQSHFVGEQSHSSPALDPSTAALYFGVNNKTFVKMRATDGHIDWSIPLGGEIKSTPLIANGCVYVTSWARKIHCVDADTGRVKWETSLHGQSQSSPTLIPESQTLVFGDSDGYLYGIDADNGKMRWERRTNLVLKGSALGSRITGGKWVAWIACGSSRLCAIEPISGKNIAEIEIPGDLTGVPVSYQGDLYLGLEYPAGLVKLGP